MPDEVCMVFCMTQDSFQFCAHCYSPVACSLGWIECWSVPICAVSIVFVYHPMPPLGPTPQADVTTPEKEEILLSPMRMPGDRGISRHVNLYHWILLLFLIPKKFC